MLMWYCGTVFRDDRKSAKEQRELPCLRFGGVCHPVEEMIHSLTFFSRSLTLSSCKGCCHVAISEGQYLAQRDGINSVHVPLFPVLLKVSFLE